MMRKPAVSGYDGLHDKFVPDVNGGGTVEWQPGDGTRYLLVAKPLDASEARLMGAAMGAMIVSMGTGDAWLTLILNPGSLHHASYVAEKAERMNFSEYTVGMLAAFSNLVLGDEEYGVWLFNQMMADRG
jgi:hypothetical protein